MHDGGETLLPGFGAVFFQKPHSSITTTGNLPQDSDNSEVVKRRPLPKTSQFDHQECEIGCGVL